MLLAFIGLVAAIFIMIVDKKKNNGILEKPCLSEKITNNAIKSDEITTGLVVEAEKESTQPKI